MKELNKLKSQEKEKKKTKEAVSNIEVMKQQREHSEKALLDYESICQLQKLKMENF